MWLLRKMAWPISLVYGAVVYLRNFLYHISFFKSKAFKTPTLCVGNLSVGGTGKTPMIEFLISHLQDHYKLAVLSRGYKRQSSGFQLATAKATVEQLGDEPFQIHLKYPHLALAVDADRQHGISQLEDLVAPELILLDDAFQHRKVQPSFSMLLTTYNAPFYDDWYLPTGNLRDAKGAAKRADVIVMTKCPGTLHVKQQEQLIAKLRQQPKQVVLFSTLVYDPLLYGGKEQLSLNQLQGRHFTLVTGIANPDALVMYLKDNNLDFEHLKFSDHHNFSASELQKIGALPLVLTTEKDYMRLKGKLNNLYCIKVAHHFLGDGDQQLIGAIKKRTTNYYSTLS